MYVQQNLLNIHNPTLYGPQNRCQRLSEYPVFLSTVKHGDCTSECGQIRENVGLLKYWITDVPLYSDTACYTVTYIAIPSGIRVSYLTWGTVSQRLLKWNLCNPTPQYSNILPNPTTSEVHDHPGEPLLNGQQNCVRWQNLSDYGITFSIM